MTDRPITQIRIETADANVYEKSEAGHPDESVRYHFPQPYKGSQVVRMYFFRYKITVLRSPDPEHYRMIYYSHNSGLPMSYGSPHLHHIEDFINASVINLEDAFTEFGYTLWCALTDREKAAVTFYEHLPGLRDTTGVPEEASCMKRVVMTIGDAINASRHRYPYNATPIRLLQRFLQDNNAYLIHSMPEGFKNFAGEENR